MPAFLFRCPATGLRVQGWTENECPDDDEFFEAVTCLACGRVHHVNPKTGRTIGKQPDDD